MFSGYKNLDIKEIEKIIANNLINTFIPDIINTNRIKMGNFLSWYNEAINVALQISLYLIL